MWVKECGLWLVEEGRPRHESPLNWDLERTIRLDTPCLERTRLRWAFKRSSNGFPICFRSFILFGTMLSSLSPGSDSKDQVILGNDANPADSMETACSKMEFISKSTFEGIKGDVCPFGRILPWSHSASVAGKSKVEDIFALLRFWCREFCGPIAPERISGQQARWSTNSFYLSIQWCVVGAVVSLMDIRSYYSFDKFYCESFLHYYNLMTLSS